MRCAVICPNVDGGRIDELPLWEFAEAERLGHGDATKQIGHERFDRWRLHNCLGFPFDYMHAMVCLIYSGLLELKLLFAEAGVSFLPFLEDRLRDEKPSNRRSPTTTSTYAAAHEQAPAA